MNKWKLLGSSVALDNKWFRVRKDKVKLPNGKVLDDFYIWENPDVALVVPVTEDNKLILVKQYKHGSGEIMIEFPAGYVDDNEKNIETAKRELEEETGFVAKKIELLKKIIHHPTKETGNSYIYLARVGNEKVRQRFDENEEIEVLEVSIREVLDMIHDGTIWATGTVLAAYLALEKLGFIKIKI
jgi:8-oxo-dGTP pyrophosphatase MutT (NUDIX family)